MSPPRVPPVAIVGRGVIALTAALVAKKSGFAPKVLLGDVAVETAHNADRFDARVVALNAQSKSLLDALGVWARLSPARVTPIRAMQVASAPGRQPMEFSALREHVEALAWVVEHGDVLDALEHAAQKAGIPRVSATAMEADFSPNRTFGATLVADAGQTTWLERTGLATQTVQYHHTALVFNVQHAASHGNVALQMFAPAAAPQSVVALLPRPRGQSTVVWSLSDASFADFRARDDVALCAALNETFHGVPAFTAVDALSSARQSVPLKLVTATRAVNGRSALIGDAAHAVHPLAGQGLNLGFGDLAALQALWRAHPADPGHPLVLASYARARVQPVTQMQALTDGLWRSISGAWPGAAAMRDIAFNVVKNVPPLRAALGQRAFGGLRN